MAANQNAELINLAVSYALDYKRVRDNLEEAARRMADAAGEMAHNLAKGGDDRFYPVGAQLATDLLSLQNELTARREALAHLLKVLGRSDDWEQFINRPFSVYDDEA